MKKIVFFLFTGISIHSFSQDGVNPTIVSGTTGSAYQSGLIDVYLSGSQTSGLPVGQFVYDIEKYPSGASNTEGAVDKILAGDFFVYPQVTT